MEGDREAPTAAELLAFAATLPVEEREKLLAAMHPAPLAPEPVGEGTVPDPVYRSWADFLAATTTAQRMAWCSRKARRANRPRLMSGPPGLRITASVVWEVLDAAAGRCGDCGSFAVEGRPSGPDGRPVAWAAIGRRIGSLGHRLARFNGGDNDRDNLYWCCLWCNTWPSERRPGATDHGAVV
ncbi:hypothetical protein [Actinoplanes derwentensis]|nr:hypothetical protein [Actinoplanes derwentensis]